MPKKVTAPKRNRGTHNTSRNRMCEGSRKDRTATKISKYFNPIQNADVSVESPYKDLLTSKDDFKPIEITDDGDDFKTPKSVRIAKVFEISKQNIVLQNKKDKRIKPKVKNISKQGSKCARKNNITKFFAKSVDSVNAEHLHMAIALSKSEVQNSEEEEGSNSDLTPSISSQEKRTRFKAALEQFGFNMNVKTKTRRTRLNVEEPNKRKKSKFKYTTPILCTRTEAERSELITNNIVLIMNSKLLKFTPIELSSSFQLSTNDLKVLHAEDPIIFKKNGSCSNNEEYFVNSLNVPHSDYVPGCLLRNWRDILGRDKSPERQIVHSFNTKESEGHLEVTLACPITNNEENEIANILDSDKEICDSTLDENIKSPIRTKSVYSKTSQMLSPDVFSSDDDEMSHETSSKENLNLSLNNSEIIKNKSDNSPRKQIMDLTVNDSVINITISQIDRLKQISVDSDFESMQLEKLEKILGDRKYKPEKIMNSSLDESNNFAGNCDLEAVNKLQKKVACEDDKIEKILGNIIGKQEKISSSLGEDFESSNFDGDCDMEGANELQKKVACEDDKFINISKNCDSDCYIVEDSKEIAATSSKTNFKRFSSFDSTTSVDSYSSQLSIEISDEELNYSTINSTSFRKQKSETRKSETRKSSFFNLSSIVANDTSDIKATSNQRNNYNKMDKQYDCSNILESLDDITSKYVNEIQEINNFDVLKNDSLLIEDDPEEDRNPLKLHNSKSKCFFNDFKYTTQKSSTSDIEATTNEVTNDNEVDMLELQSPKMHGSSNYSKILASLDDITLKYGKEIQETDSLNKLNKSDDDDDLLPLKLHNSNKSKSSINEFKPTNINSNDLTPTLTKSPSGTPNNDNMLIKTDNITPVPNYLDMDTPKIVGELRKFGLKPLKRKRGVQLLQYLYDVTHPEVPDGKVDESECQESAAKKRKAVRNLESANSFSAVDDVSAERIEIVGDLISESELISDLILEQRKSVKLSTCAVPLNIAWHNLLAANSSIRETMLMYEPLEVERLYAMLKKQGLKYNVQDVITFLDKKCITIRTKQNTGKRK